MQASEEEPKRVQGDQTGYSCWLKEGQEKPEGSAPRGQRTQGVMGQAPSPTYIPSHWAALASTLLGMRCRELC